MQTINIKPLSINQAWQGKRFKSSKYIAFETECLLKLRKIEIPDGDLKVKYEFGVSSKLFDIDNGIKAFTDVLQKKYDFNDRRIMELEVRKEIVSKGEEYIKFEIKEI